MADRRLEERRHQLLQYVLELRREQRLVEVQLRLVAEMTPEPFGKRNPSHVPPPAASNQPACSLSV